MPDTPFSLKPICFVVMPFGTKDVPNPPPGAPSRIDFNRLWEMVIRPAVERLGYEPVRADQEIGALIIHEMLERLFFADLVVADMTLPNGNVYYEVGVRHAAKRHGCVLISANWSQPLFDTQQMRRVTYPLPSATVNETEATAASHQIEVGIRCLREGDSPIYQVLPNYPNPSPDRALTLRSEMARLTAFQEQIRTVDLLADPAQAREQALTLAAQYPATEQLQIPVAMAIVQLLRDHAGWSEMLAYVQALPRSLRDTAYLREQAALAQSKLGDHRQTIAALETLNRMLGPSSERLGLLGGSHKRLAQEATERGDARTAQRHHQTAIECYERGMRLELGNYYCTSNLARLYRTRNEEGDTQQALFAQQLTRLMVETAIARGTADEWAMATLLGAAFDAGDVKAAHQAVRTLENGGTHRWKLETTAADLARSLTQQTDAHLRAQLQNVLDHFNTLINPCT